jgi:HEAT repeat protein
MTSSRFIPVFLMFLLVPFVSAQDGDDPKSKKGSPALDGLKALKHPDANVRYRAVATLAQLGSVAKFAVPELRELLKDKSGLVRVKTAEALWKIDQTPSTSLMPVLLQALKDKEAVVRAAAPPVLALLGSKAKNALPALVQALQDQDFDVKLSAITALGDLGTVAKGTADDLLDLTRDKDFFLLEPFVGAALTNLGDSVVPTLAAALANKSPDRRRVAAYALGSMGPAAAPAAAALADALKSDDLATRKQAARALGKIGKDAAKTLPRLEAVLADKDASVRIEAALATWFITDDPRHVAVIIKALTDESADVRVNACQALGAMKSAAKEAVAPLTKLLADKDLRIRVIFTLGQVGPPAEKAVPELKKLLKDKDGETRLSSAFALWQITAQAKETLALLVENLGSAENDRFAIRLLGDMGEAAQTVLPTLAALYREEEEVGFRQLLGDAIKKIDPKAAAKLGIR